MVGVDVFPIESSSLFRCFWLLVSGRVFFVFDFQGFNINSLGKNPKSKRNPNRIPVWGKRLGFTLGEDEREPPSPWNLGTQILEVNFTSPEVCRAAHRIMTVLSFPWQTMVETMPGWDVFFWAASVFPRGSAFSKENEIRK